MAITTSDVLAGAADLIDERGWWNGNDDRNETDPNSPLCAGLAIGEAADDAGLIRHNRMFDAFARFLGLDSPLSISVIYDWNDAQPDGESVIKALRDAAEANR